MNCKTYLKDGQTMKPYIIAHMMISLDGKASGEFLTSDTASTSSEYYYNIHHELRSYADAFACGRVTMEESFTHYHQLDLTPYENIEIPQSEYYMSEKSEFYAVCFDTYGRVGWTHKYIQDDDPSYDHAAIIEVVSKQVPTAYLAYLRSKKINYIIAGDTQIDIPLALSRLKKLFRSQTLILEGGPTLNQSIQNLGLIDDLSLVVIPALGGKDAKPLFLDSCLEEYVLTHHRIHDDDSLYLRYSKK